MEPRIIRKTLIISELCASLHVKEEVHNVSVLDYVVLAFDAHFAGGADGGFRLVVDKVLILNYFCPDKAALEVRVDWMRRTTPLSLRPISSRNICRSS